MIYALFVGGSAFLISLLLGAFIVPALRGRNIGKVISAEGPTTHHVKQGTPTMGGLIIYGTVALVTVVTNIFEIRNGGLVFERRSILLPLFVVIFTMAIGFWDDLGTLTSVIGRRALSWRLKFLLIGGLSAVVAYTLYFQLDARSANVPWAGQVDLGPIYLVIAVITVFATTSAVSITDGLDGLLGGTAAIAFAAYAVIAFIQGQEFLATFSFTVVGALLGFLWYNAHPAQVFMGDTGALPLGASLATVALMTGHWLLLPIIGIVFVANAGSTVLQIAYFQTTGGRRLFRMTPLHHHFELLGWSEPQVVLRMWLFAFAGAMVGVALALSV
ncbi:MAG: phospho-N-acetylmuramoyl-pentapeptide-transferase [Chloroflexi bacterium]|nr:phospho-N-acetylmuramoyl-pentapeptide-transferase [Chloroflexota bacterium]MDA1147480.1 phospho-N-acetylmuramoyl-pentapeptide-transferase [Chloroflexota bacterium]MQC83027.1 phospho-N-acetylmuramoyl-pentapeptide-transferase [Chloroflexota bacterium]PKB56607.1 MAG: phospho-N-acetylmuramoyl-pentapeptide-transferase [SAR202 cluster bacterium Casp-Chloro-G1]